MTTAGVWAARARTSWQALLDHCVRRRRGGLLVCEPARRRPVAAWPLSQVIWTAAIMDRLADTFDTLRDPDLSEGLWRGLARYRCGDAYVDNRPRGKRYFDDNAWLGLAAAQTAIVDGSSRWWQRAVDSARFVSFGQRPSGGVLWVERGSTLNACSTGSAALLLRTVAKREPGLDQGEARDFLRRADRAQSFLSQVLLRQDGLVADHLAADGEIEPSVWAYNQGLLLELFNTGDAGSRRRAASFATHASQALPTPELLRQPAAFSCLWLRARLQLASQRLGDSGEDVERYLQPVWAQARRSDGLLTEVSRYDNNVVLDHVALTGLMAAFALGRAGWAEIL